VSSLFSRNKIYQSRITGGIGPLILLNVFKTPSLTVPEISGSRFQKRFMIERQKHCHVAAVRGRLRIQARAMRKDTVAAQGQ
jgi:hypothetical protein